MLFKSGWVCICRFGQGFRRGELLCVVGRSIIMLGKGRHLGERRGGTSKVDTAGVKEGELRALRGTLMQKDF